MATQGKRRAFGQHFLKDTIVTHGIVDAAFELAEQNKCVSILEIGPGKGALTQPILEKLSTQSQIHEYRIIEKDRVLGERWQNAAYPKNIQVKVVVEDFLKLQPEQWFKHHPAVVVSNLPYSVGTAILDRLARFPERIPVMVLMFQAEVAERIRAIPGTKQWGSLSLWVQNCWEVEKLLRVPPNAFSPPPEVNSEVIILKRRPAPLIPGTEETKNGELWEKLLKAGFSHRRKMLRSYFPWRNALELSHVDGTKRAEALHWEEWNRLFEVIQKHSS